MKPTLLIPLLDAISYPAMELELFGLRKGGT